MLNENLKLVSFYVCVFWFWSGLVHFQEAGGFGDCDLQDSSNLGGKSKMFFFNVLMVCSIVSIDVLLL